MLDKLSQVEYTCFAITMPGWPIPFNLIHRLDGCVSLAVECCACVFNVLAVLSLSKRLKTWPDDEITEKFEQNNKGYNSFHDSKTPECSGLLKK